MDLSLLDYRLPSELVAQTPASPRDHSRLLVVDRKSKNIQHKNFYQIADLLSSNDVLVFNKTKVFPARLFGKKESGKNIEILLLEEKESGIWTAIRKGKVQVNDKIYFGKLETKVMKIADYEIYLDFALPRQKVLTKLSEIGQTPLPPYIHSKGSEKDIRQKYQTIYAEVEGSVAAPTAGLHFTNELINKLKAKNIQLEYLTLHVGLGTFLPIKDQDITKHKMHSEHFEVDQNTYDRLITAKKNGKRIIAVGTTTTRVLESVFPQKLTGETNIFIYPEYKFKFVDALITNFHLPKSTLLALISAFVCYPNTNDKFKNFNESLMGRAYQEAIHNKYRFYSFGDSCFIY